MRAPIIRWAVQWHSCTALDGEHKHFVWSGTLPLLFRTRTEAREFIERKWGYVRTRDDLRNEPHGWRMPQPVKVRVDLVEVEP